MSGVDENVATQKEPVLVVDVGAGGAGDTMALCWLAEGYKRMGERMVLATIDKDRARMVEMFGQETVWDVSTPLKAGAHAPWYKTELEVVRGTKPRLEVWGSHMPGCPKPVRPPFKPSDQAVEEMDRVVKGQLGDEPFVLVFPWVAWAGREWPLVHWVEMADILRRKGLPVVFATDLGRHGRNVAKLRQGPAWLKFWYGYDWERMGVVCSRAALVAGADTGGTWMGATVGTATLALMGPTLNVFGGIENVEEMSVSASRKWCVGCMFRSDAGYRAACGYQCQALMELKPGEVAERVYERVKGGVTPLRQLEV